MTPRIVVLGAGFGGLELSSALSDALGTEADVTLIDKSDSFMFGFSKLDVLFGRASREELSLPYSAIAKPGIRLVQETVTAIDPASRRVATDGGEYEADHLVVALGVDYAYDTTPGLTDLNTFYTRAGAERLAEPVASFTGGHAVVGVCGVPYKCTPAPSECALLLHDAFVRRGVRDRCEITYVVPQPNPVPPSADAARVVLEAFAERGITFVPGRGIASLDRSIATLDDGTEIAYDLFLGVPKHRVPDVVLASGLAVDGYIPVDPATLATSHPGVYAIGDCANAGVPKAGAFAEGAGRAVAARLIAAVRGDPPPEPYRGTGACYVEFGGGQVGRVNIDASGGPPPKGTFTGPSEELAAEKHQFGAARRARWFGL